MELGREMEIGKGHGDGGRVGNGERTLRWERDGVGKGREGS